MCPCHSLRIRSHHPPLVASTEANLPCPCLVKGVWPTYHGVRMSPSLSSLTVRRIYITSPASPQSCGMDQR
ncbi:hypothetical protein HETIRDRAFT_382367 [Heterobasidion irregulare TC 32-1]|uniref:Uncharacterized protein n=1 Tax=Heterobasidion irregulare (strain TC 32-1) TaxID=747525 RepID=W4KFU1_HETIT|nr:uncharacterized protein HETIRDRAFT_382367 [Heterobasidion irregulare TC 32-1]ETW84717.1 hypothetical protein HETIRDRAFT_382367 [Heterobasidion irregulare TC 32-1]